MSAPVRVKICGLTRVQDALAAARAGADFLGVVLYPRSPRYLPPAQAAALVDAVRQRLGDRSPRWVAVLVNPAPDLLEAVLHQVQPDLLQLHGDEPPAALEALAGRAYKALRLRPGAPLPDAAAYARYAPSDPALPQLLVDAFAPHAYGGTGQRADWHGAAVLARAHRLLLAGGLTPENVRQAVRRVRPWGVDLSSGVESAPGVKSHPRIQALLQALRGPENPPGW